MSKFSKMHRNPFFRFIFSKIGPVNSQKFDVLLFFLFCGFFSTAQSLSPEKINTAAGEKFPEAIFNLIDFLKLPNDGHFENEIQQNLKWCDSVFTDLKFETQAIKTEGAPYSLPKKKSIKN